MARAAVLRRQGDPLAIEEIDLEPTGPDQVRVRIVATGVCRSDMFMQDGTREHPVPVVLGHEGAGVIEDAGEDVTNVAVGDHVLLANSPPCTYCWYCQNQLPYLCDGQVEHVLSKPYARLKSGERLIPAMGVATFATETLALARGCFTVPPDIPLDIAVLVSCAVTTGAGAALFIARVTEGSTVVVIGCGGVGLSAILGAIGAGAGQVIAVDPVQTRRECALALGASHAIDPSSADVVEAVFELTDGRGCDFALEAVGTARTIEQAYFSARRGGTIVVIGAAEAGEIVSIPAFRLFDDAKVMIGCQSGNIDPGTAFPHLVQMWRDGKLPIDRLISRRAPLEDVNHALDDLRRGQGLRTVLVNS